MNCSNCGNALGTSAKFCSKCGAIQSNQHQVHQHNVAQQPLNIPQYQAQQPLNIPQHQAQQPLNIPQHQAQQPHNIPQHQAQQPHNIPQHQTQQPHNIPQHQTQQPLNIPQHQTQQPLNIPQHQVQQPHYVAQPQIQQPQINQHYMNQDEYAPARQETAPKKSRAPIVVVCLIIALIAIGFVAVTTDIGPSMLFADRRSSGDEETAAIVTRDDIVEETIVDEITEADDIAEYVELTPTQIFANNVDAVFQIYLADADGEFFGTGSGFFVNSTGVAVTNHHVMVDAPIAIAVLEDGRELNILGHYSYCIDNDLAIIQLENDGQGFSYLTIGDSDAVSVGDTVYAIGSPEGDRNTFTVGYVSRFASEPVSFGIYTIEGLIQMTAAIYGGSSGGALLNERGHVIGVNSAVNILRPSVAWAVPISRVVLPESESELYFPLPIESSDYVQQDGGIFAFARYPFIPDFLSIVNDDSLILSGTAEDLESDLILDFDSDGIYHFDYAYLYHLENEHFIPTTDMYDEILEEQGFVFQGVLLDDEITYVFLYHEYQDVSLVYSYYWELEALLILIGEGNAFELLEPRGTPEPHEIPDNATLDTELSASWFFVETTNAQYQGWIAQGFDLYYIFNEDGSGTFISSNQESGVTQTFEFNWYTANGSVTIMYFGNFVDTYVYEYQIINSGLFMVDAVDEHALIRTQ